MGVQFHTVRQAHLHARGISGSMNGFGIEKAGTVALGLLAPEGAKLLGGRAIAGKDVVSMGGRSVPALACVEHEDGAPCTGKNESGGKASGTTADDEDIICHGSIFV